MGKCEETAGFLISAPCNHKAVEKCRSCHKHVCDIHSRDAAPRAGKHCITCHRKLGARYEHETDDPYLYSGYVFPAYYSTYAAGDAWESHRGAFEEESPGPDDPDWEGDFDGS